MAVGMAVVMVVDVEVIMEEAMDKVKAAFNSYYNILLASCYRYF